MRADANPTHAERNAAQIAVLRAEAPVTKPPPARVLQLLTHVLRSARPDHLALLLDTEEHTITALLERMEADRQVELNPLDGRWALPRGRA